MIQCAHGSEILQGIVYASVDPVPGRHLLSPGANELNAM